MSGLRHLIVNADDFGRSESINRGVCRAHDEGIVTSASLMVRFPAAAEAAVQARARPRLALGLHLDLGEWRYERGTWREVYVRADLSSARSVRREVEAQLAAFRELVGGDPTHLDSHQHVHRDDPVRSIALELGEKLRVPVRELTPGIAYRGDFYGQTGRGEPLPELVRASALAGLIKTLQPGITEVGCHPGAGTEPGDDYTARPLELAALCDPAARAAVAEREAILCSFASEPVRALVAMAA